MPLNFAFLIVVMMLIIKSDPLMVGHNNIQILEIKSLNIPRNHLFKQKFKFFYIEKIVMECAG